MEELLRALVMILLYVLYIVLIPVVMLVATPVILLWPAKKGPAGQRGRRDIRGRYRKLWKVWESTGLGLPSS
jgi:hypothetical protein